MNLQLWDDGEEKDINRMTIGRGGERGEREKGEKEEEEKIRMKARKEGAGRASGGAAPLM